MDCLFPIFIQYFLFPSFNIIFSLFLNQASRDTLSNSNSHIDATRQGQGMQKLSLFLKSSDALNMYIEEAYTNEVSIIIRKSYRCLNQLIKVLCH